MVEIPEIQGNQVLLRSIKESDIDDRLSIGRHREFVHMCGGESLSAPEFPDRAVWESWYDRCKNDEFKKDGVLRENAYIEGKYYSDIVMSILDYEYQQKYVRVR